MNSPVLPRSTLSSAIALVFASSAGAAFAQAAAPAAPAASAAVDNAPQVVVISASADASAGGLKAEYAGGQVARGGRVGILGSQDVMDTPFVITNYTHTLIQDQQSQSIADVLRNDPAVRVARGFGNFQQTYVVRGRAVYSDDMSYNGLYGLLPRQYLAAELVERVEVLRGASAFVNGAAPGGSGLGGAVNASPKRAPNTPLTEFTLGAESGGATSGAVDIARRFGPGGALGVRLNVIDRDGDTAVHGENVRLLASTLGADWRQGDLRVSADIGSQDHELRGTTPSITIGVDADGHGLPVPGAPDGKLQIAQPWTTSKETDTFGTLRTEYDFTGAITGWAAGGFRDGHESASFANPTVTDAAGSMNAYRFDNVRHDIVQTGELGLRGKLRTGEVGHALVASAAAYQLASKNAYAFSSFAGEDVGTLAAPVFVAAPSADFFTGGKFDAPGTTLRTKTSSIALADTLSLLQDRLRVTVGARHQRIESDAYDDDTGAAAASNVASSRTTPVGGIVFKPMRQLSLYATYVEGLVAGQIAPETSGSTVVTNAGEVFKPFKTTQIEVGAKFDLGRFGGALNFYRSREPIAAVDAEGRYGVQDHDRIQGAELSVFGEAARGLRVLGGASFTDSELAGHDEIGVPKTQVNLGIDWDVPGVAGLAVDARGVRTSRQFADAANTQVVPSSTTFDLGARYAMDVGAQTLTLRARVENVTGRNYWASAGGYPGAGYLTVGAPRALRVSGTLSF